MNNYPKTNRIRKFLAVTCLLTLGALMLSQVSIAGSPGIKITYYQTSACVVPIGYEIFGCPESTDMVGADSEFFTTETIQCDCSGGGDDNGDDGGF